MTDKYTIDNAVRNITRVGVCPAPKSKVKEIIESLVSQVEREAERRQWTKDKFAVLEVKEKSLNKSMGGSGGWNEVSHGFIKCYTALDAVKPDDL